MKNGKPVIESDESIDLEQVQDTSYQLQVIFNKSRTYEQDSYYANQLIKANSSLTLKQNQNKWVANQFNKGSINESNRDG